MKISKHHLRKKPIIRDAALASNVPEGRSILANLTKAEIVETIVASFPRTAYAYIIPLLSKKLGLLLTKFCSDAVADMATKTKALMTLSRKQLVDIVYHHNDDRLNARYGGTPQQTVPTERRTDILKSRFVLRGDRAIELSPHWAKQFRNRNKKKYRRNIGRIVKAVMAPAPKARKPRRKPRKVIRRLRKESKLKAVNWVAAMRQHNAAITEVRYDDKITYSTYKVD